MKELATKARSASAVDAEQLFQRLGLHLADARPIMEAWREANAEWRRERFRRVAAHAQRVRDHLQRFRRLDLSSAAKVQTRPGMGRRRAVWCVELRRCFTSMTQAAVFVNRKPSNISQSLQRGVRCGPYHWETYDAGKHG